LNPVPLGTGSREMMQDYPLHVLDATEGTQIEGRVLS
jgi:hypothetical protein